MENTRAYEHTIRRFLDACSETDKKRRLLHLSLLTYSDDIKSITQTEWETVGVLVHNFLLSSSEEAWQKYVDYIDSLKE